MKVFLYKCALFCGLVHVLFARPPDQSASQDLIDTLQSTCDNKIMLVIERIDEMERENDRRTTGLEERILHLENQNQKLTNENFKNKNTIAILANMINKMSNATDIVGHGIVQNQSKISKETNSPRRKPSQMANKDVEINRYQTRNYGPTIRALDYGMNIAFTAYLDHDLDHQGKSQVLIFNKVLLNDGNAYNNFTGTFTAPVTGVYSISFFVGQRDPNEVRAYMVVNNIHKVDAVAESLHGGQDLQGGNTANLRLNLGDSVYITHQGAGTHIEGAPGLRTTTFSGFLIYPIEIQPVAVVGK